MTVIFYWQFLDDELWMKRIPDESNISKYYRGSMSSSRYSKSFLNPDSDVIEALDDDEPFWERLDDTDPNMLPRRTSGTNHRKSVRKCTYIKLF